MKIPLALLLMIALLSMTVASANAQLSAPSCAGQLRVGDVCQAAALPVPSPDKGKTGGICCEMFPPAEAPGLAPVARPAAHVEPARPRAASRMQPHWRPPRL